MERLPARASLPQRLFTMLKNRDAELDHRNYDEGETRREFLYERTIDGIKDVLSGTEDLILVAHKGSIKISLLDGLFH